MNADRAGIPPPTSYINPMRWVVVGWIVLLASALAQNWVPNGSFEQGTDRPDGWQLWEGKGEWLMEGFTGTRAVLVRGNGNDSNAWVCTDWQPQPNHTYLVRCRLRVEPNSTGGTPIVGFTTANYDAWTISRDGKWYTVSFICRTPLQKESLLRFGQWQVRGSVAYDEIEVYSVAPVHRQIEGITLGEGELIRDGVYRFVTRYLGFATNQSRPLYAHTATFNTHRWVFTQPLGEGDPPSGDWVVYQHVIGIPFRSAKLVVQIGYRESGELVVELSTDGTRWREVGRFGQSGMHTMELPADGFPTDTLWVRLWATGVLQVQHYEISAPLARSAPNLLGSSWYFLQTQSQKELQAEPLVLEAHALEVRLHNQTSRAQRVGVQLADPSTKRRQQVLIPPKDAITVRLAVPTPTQRVQNLSLTVLQGRKKMSEHQAEIVRPWIELGGFGYSVARSEGLNLWWSHATYKVGQTTPTPERASPIRIECARNEYEPFQLMLTPQQPLKQLTLRFLPFEGGQGNSPRPVWDEIARVDYVPVTIPTDRWGALGDYPDPLVPLYQRARWTPEGDEPRAVQIVLNDLPAHRNRPLWITVFVPKETPKGTYRARIQIVEAIGADGRRVPVPRSPIRVELRVFGFTLPDDTPLRTAYGVSIDNEWHRLRTPEQFRKVWDMYMQVCRRYRISPYTPHAYAPIKWEVVEQDGTLQFRYDFTEFDRAMTRYLDEFRFNSWNLVILPEQLGGHAQFTPEWTRLYQQLMAPILQHLRQKGWLDKAYCYWIDEPHTPEQYELTKRGMQALKDGAPGVRRLLTNYIERFPSPTFYDLVDLWVPIMNQFDEERARQRQALGEEVWWYVCTGPKEPFPNNFIDHPAITHRIRYWMMFRWGLDGDLYWSITYMRGQNWRVRNPYEDAQSETPEGGYWGNGDGRLLYPPVRQPLPEDAEPVLEPPLPSLRLALISEGIEDFCYLWLLSTLLEQHRSTGVSPTSPNGSTGVSPTSPNGSTGVSPTSPNRSTGVSPVQVDRAIQQAEMALQNALALIRSQTEYETDPLRLMEARRRVAEAIERLSNQL